jgi:hypothetical protein
MLNENTLRKIIDKNVKSILKEMKNRSLAEEITESAVRRVMSRLNEDDHIKLYVDGEEWMDKTPKRYAYHIGYLGETEGEEEEDLAYALYDKLSHCEMETGKAIEFVLTNGVQDNCVEPEILPRSARNCGETDRYILTYDSYTGAFDVWEKTR